MKPRVKIRKKEADLDYKALYLKEVEDHKDTKTREGKLEAIVSQARRREFASRKEAYNQEERCSSLEESLCTIRVKLKGLNNKVSLLRSMVKARDRVLKRNKLVIPKVKKKKEKEKMITMPWFYDRQTPKNAEDKRNASIRDGQLRSMHQQKGRANGVR